MRLADPRYRLLALVCCGVVIVDQLAKLWVTLTIPLQTSRVVLPGFFDLVHIRNRGAAFGFLNRPDIQWQFWIFLFATILAAGVIFSLIRSVRRNQYWLISSLGLVLGGALGNLLDRLRFRAVVDFLDFYIGQWHWPAFNIADMAICSGGILVCCMLWHAPKMQQKLMSSNVREGGE